MIADAAFAASAIAFSAAGGKCNARASGARIIDKARTAGSLKRTCRSRFVYYRGNLVSKIKLLTAL